MVLGSVQRPGHRHGSLEFLTGWAVSSVVLGGLCYGLVQLGWWLGLLIKGRRKHGEDGKRARPPHEGRPK